MHFEPEDSESAFQKGEFIAPQAGCFSVGLRSPIVSQPVAQNKGQIEPHPFCKQRIFGLLVANASEIGVCRFWSSGSLSVPQTILWRRRSNLASHAAPRLGSKAEGSNSVPTTTRSKQRTANKGMLFQRLSRWTWDNRKV